MPFKAGFAEIDITPPVGVRKIGWLRLTVSDHVLDPLYARVAVLESESGKVAFVQLDTLSIRWTQVNDIRKRVTAKYGFPGQNVMVCATHNHAGPAVTGGVEFQREEAYIETMVQKIVEALGQALNNMQDAQFGFGMDFEFDIGFNRRVIMRSGITRTHGSFKDPNALCLEGPVDPEVAVLAARKNNGELLGALVNFACHPTHWGHDGTLSAGWPGVFANEMKKRNCPVPMFINGSAGNVHTANPAKPGQDKSMEDAGRTLADDACRILEKITWRNEVKVGSRLKTIQLPYRNVTEDEIKGTVHGAQRFVDPKLYDQFMPRLVERIRKKGAQPADVQVQFLDEVAVAGIPAEYFVQLGLRIKEQSHPRHALVAGFTNGMVGYVPHKEAFLRGGYETTLGMVSWVAPGAGEMLADTAVELIREGV